MDAIEDAFQNEGGDGAHVLRQEAAVYGDDLGDVGYARFGQAGIGLRDEHVAGRWGQLPIWAEGDAHGRFQQTSVKSITLNDEDGLGVRHFRRLAPPDLPLLEANVGYHDSLL